MQIHGKEILNFPYGDRIIGRQHCDFDIDEKSHEFLIQVENVTMEEDFEFLFSNQIVHKECLFCMDEAGKEFVIYDCYISPMQIPVKQMKITWNKYLLGHHIENVQDEKIISAEYVIQTNKKKYPFHMFVGKNDFYIQNDTVHIKTEWNKNNSCYEGVLIDVSMNVPMVVEEVETIILRLLEIFFLQIGFFPKVEKRKMLSEFGKEFYFWEEFAAYGKTADRNIKLDYVLHTENSTPFPIIYDKWCKLREKEVITFNLFSYLTTESSPVMEVPIATCIQCLEGYFRVHHKDELLRFSNSAKKQIKAEILNLLENSDKIKGICKEDGIDLKSIINSFDALSGHINEYSLKDILRYAIERDDATKKVFEYGRSTSITERMLVIDLFIQKATGHRNWLSHLMDQKRRFVGSEINLANEKLRLLFRLTLMHDIGIEVTNSSLEMVVDKVNRWYKNNILQ